MNGKIESPARRAGGRRAKRIPSTRKAADLLSRVYRPRRANTDLSRHWRGVPGVGLYDLRAAIALEAESLDDFALGRIHVSEDGSSKGFWEPDAPG